MRIRDARIVATAVGPAGFPSDELPEIAFLGRSNAGKSSLLNALAGRRELARVSSTPGKTRALHFFRIERLDDADRVSSLLFVDLPGYGFARVARSERAAWQRLVESYLTARAPLRAAVLIQDLRRDVGDDERDLVAWLAERGIPVLVALAKSDKLKAGARGVRWRALRADYGLEDARVLLTSAKTKLGIDALWAAIDAQIEAGAAAAPGDQNRP
ncbi:ribosome biogenesis GTP-binding protein YihA/YsxC [Myxococcota bacterium]|nr:ribosome biogenesis GTP-binding protein YihA/YsxC [Myxococcota bacterium]MCZ7620024.1 ribosome biogenesis GTP-binding protein YihA/YsxC [Myxococcota bacterium]